MLVERLRDRVREDVGAADHGDAEDDRERGQDGAGLAARARPLSATRFIAGSPPPSPRALACARRAEVLDDPAVGEEEDPVGDRRGARVVGDHHGRLAVARRPTSRSSSRISPLVARVEVAGRLVGEHDRRPRDERPGDATRCCWPPESSLGRCVRRSPSPTFSISSSNHSWSGLRAGDRERQQRCSPPPSASAAG